MQSDTGELTIRNMTEKDLDEVLTIERDAFSEPWSENMFRREMCLPLSQCLTASVERDGVVGYIIFWLVAGEAHLHNIAVRKDRQRKGVAFALMKEMMSKARKNGALCATLEVRPSNDRARRLYDKLGFELLGVRSNYYADTGEDALIMQADLTG